MDITAIICEYNPFHNGHFHQIHTLKAKENSAVVALMSGNFVQRGEPAYFSKFLRAKAALASGADLVLEMPLYTTLQSAEGFALGCVSLLNELGVINALCFGVSNPDSEAIQTVAGFLNSHETITAIKELKKQGLSHPIAITTLVKKHLGESYLPFVQEANNILAVEYCKALLSLSSAITPLPLARKEVAHNGTQKGAFASATHLRELLQRPSQKEENWQPLVPQNTLPLYHQGLEKGRFTSFNKFNFALLSYLKKCTHANFSEVTDVTGGFEYKLEKAVKEAVDYNKLIESLVDKTHTRASVKRILLNAFLQTPKTTTNFVRVLGFGKLGEEVLKKMKQNSKIPFSHRLQDCKEKDYVHFVSKATDIYNLCQHSPKPSGEEFTAFISKENSF